MFERTPMPERPSVAARYGIPGSSASRRLELRAQARRRAKRAQRAAAAFWATVILGCLAFWAIVAFVVVHFIVKYW